MAFQYLQVITTAGKLKTANKIASETTGKRLASCAQIIGPIKSRYWWKGKLETKREWQIILKTRQDLYKALEDEIRKWHPYEIPEIIAIPVVEGLPEYLDWIGKETKVEMRGVCGN